MSLQPKNPLEALPQLLQAMKGLCEANLIVQREIAAENRREAAIQRYLDYMSDLLLHERLQSPDI